MTWDFARADDMMYHQVALAHHGKTAPAVHAEDLWVIAGKTRLGWYWVRCILHGVCIIKNVYIIK